MAPTTPIFLALLFSLISGSTEGGQKMDPVALLQDTFKYWLDIYNGYQDEAILGYCWANYLLGIRDESSNLFGQLATTEDSFHMNTGPTIYKYLRYSPPENSMMDLAWFGGTRGKRSLEKRSRTTAISHLTADPNEHRFTPESKIIKEHGKSMMSEVEVSNNDEENNETNEKFTRLVNSYVSKRRRAFLTTPPRFSNEESKFPRGYKFSSRGTSSRAVNMEPNPKNDDEVSSKSRDLEQNRRNKVLRPLTSDLGSFTEDSFEPRIFSLKVSRRKRRESLDGHRFPFRQYPSQDGGSNSRVGRSLFDPELPDPEIKKDPEGHQLPLNNDGSSSTSSRSQFRRVNARQDRRVGAIKLMDSKGNSSRNLEGAINSRMPRREPEKLSRDPLLLPRERFAERSSLKSRENAEALKKDLPRHEGTGGSDVRKRGYQEQRRNKSRRGRDTSAAIQPKKRSVWYPSRFYQPYRSPFEDLELFTRFLIKTLQESSYNAPSLDVEQSTNDFEDLTNKTVQNLEPNTLPIPKYQSTSHVQSSFSISSLFITVLKTLGMFIRVGRKVMNVVQSNALLVCTSEYLWNKMVRWSYG